MDISAEGPIETVTEYKPENPGYKSVLYGTSNGQICQVLGTKEGLQSGWIIPNEDNSSVLSLDTYDFTHSDQLDILVFINIFRLVEIMVVYKYYLFQYLLKLLYLY